MKVGLISLGCPRNKVDSEKILFRLKNKGFKITSPQASQILIINTCAFIEPAKVESIETIKEALDLKRKGKLSKVIVWGCLVKRYKTLLAKYLKDIDALIGVINWENPQRILSEPTHLSYLKIAEGCSNLCSYCAIPLIRGTLKSRKPETILEEVRFLDKKGVKELNIVAQDITSWGKDLYKRRDLVWLLEKILTETKNIAWLRLLYTHPKFLTKRLVKLIATEEKICNYLDLPIQHINNRILKLMNRQITKQEIEEKINYLRREIPDIALRTTLIAGFPTEKEEEFLELIEFIKKYKFWHLGAFLYSKEENTKAYKLRELPRKLKKKRLRTIMETQQKISYQINKSLVGKIFDVIIDESGIKFSVGRAYFQAYDIDTEIIIPQRLKRGKFYKVKIIQSYEYDLLGKALT
ncbi:MAG: 30S ribosomal protein S12 methylthiotransferase RimO [Candidatus Omnitrophota bacterium]|nr:MAG: 30S ribosomal protein S12 methylthiotransferase RimO [Candidatus Omnitrophota bacterium]